MEEKRASGAIGRPLIAGRIAHEVNIVSFFQCTIYSDDKTTASRHWDADTQHTATVDKDAQVLAARHHLSLSLAASESGDLL